MSKKSKKRTKRYQGEDAKHRSVATERAVHRFEAVERSRLSEWWQPRKKIARVGGIITAIVGGAAWLIIELFQLIF